MFRRFATTRRSAKHDHKYEVHNVGADLQRRVCSICGQVSISASRPVSVRPARTEPERVFSPPPLTVVVDDTVAPVGLSWQFADRRTAR